MFYQKLLGFRLFPFTEVFLVSIFLLMGCTGKKNQQGLIGDPHSFANFQEVYVTHLDLELKTDFQKHILSGVARLTINNRKGTDKLILDTHQLTIEKVTLGEEESNTEFQMGKSDPILGTPLMIQISPNTKIVNVYYHTSPEALAVQWLTPEQTAGKKYPYLYTQSEAILARTWVPCQDTPAVRFTYSATVETDPHLLALMSARNPTEKTKDGIYHFEMPQPIPSYLLALAIGDISFQSLGPRSGVYSEPAVVKKAAWEFADTEKMIDTAEKLYGPYRWERYDILVLPPSFPFGGMENPRLTFATPTVLAGDRSLVSLIAHELAHSWSGNLVTNANWNDFWLNEGFTTYFERRIVEALYGRNFSEMEASLAYQDLLKTIKELGENNPLTKLHLDLKGKDPDVAMGDIAYEKGYFFLRMMEENIGREKWDAFLRRYFDTFAFQSMTTDKFFNYLVANLLHNDQAMVKKLKIREWLYGTGLPDNCPVVKSREFEKVDAQLKAFLNGTPASQLKTGEWTTLHWLRFLRQMPDSLPLEKMRELDRTFHFTETGNSEILAVWLELSIHTGYKTAYPALERFLTSQGRRKFLRPLYQALAETPQGLRLARQIYLKARPMYHAISRNTIDKILNWQPT